MNHGKRIITIEDAVSIKVFQAVKLIIWIRVLPIQSQIAVIVIEQGVPDEVALMAL